MSHRALGCSKSNTKHVALVRNVDVPLAADGKMKIKREGEGTDSQRTLTGRSTNSKIAPFSSRSFVPSTAASSAREQINKMLNFPMDDQIYRGLVPVNVNDSIVHKDCPPLNKRAMHKKYLQKMANKKKDPEPDFKDFLSDIKPLTEAYPKYKIDQRVDFKLLPELPRGNYDKIEEIILKLSTYD